MAKSFSEFLAEQKERSPGLKEKVNIATAGTTFYLNHIKEKGLGRIVLNNTLNIISNRATNTRFITLSPKTEMAKRFHLSNGATLLQENFDTNNFEYKV